MINAVPASTPAEGINQSVYYVEKAGKKALLHQVLQSDDIETVLIFTRTKHGANKVAQDLNKIGITAEAIHGNKSQQARQNALNGFKNRTIKVLVATDIASRGIDVEKLSHVINYELPEVPETYIHRIGRTARAGLKGTAISFCSSEERGSLKDINKLLPASIEVKRMVGFTAEEGASSLPIATDGIKRSEHRRQGNPAAKPRRTFYRSRR
jgi:ATP-dependent RNA helicase RhlE